MVEKVPKNLKEMDEIIKNTDPNNMTPLEALQLVAKLKDIDEKKWSRLRDFFLEVFR